MHRSWESGDEQLDMFTPFIGENDDFDESDWDDAPEELDFDDDDDDDDDPYDDYEEEFDPDLP